MQALQQILNLSFEATLYLGLTAIFLHAIWTDHLNWMTEHCPPVKPYQPTQAPKKATPIIPKEPETPKEKPTLELEKYTVKLLVDICKLDRKYKGYSKYQKQGKKALIEWMQTKN